MTEPHVSEFSGGPAAIAIDGPAASGKTTVGRILADRLGYLFVDTGCMYRAVTLAALESGVDTDSENDVLGLARQLRLEIESAAPLDDGRLYTVLMNGRDVTWDIRKSAVDRHVSRVSAYGAVRELLVDRQRAMAGATRVVMVGRDIGTVVLPHAPLKLYIVASPEERARRRWRELRDRGLDWTYQRILADIIRRDRYDGSRQHSPMRQAEDAILVDTTGRSPSEVVDDILRLPHFEADEVSE